MRCRYLGRGLTRYLTMNGSGPVSDANGKIQLTKL